MKENIEVKVGKDIELRMVKAKFKDFKSKNNLDEYFEKYLTDDTRKTTVKLVAELLE